MKKLLCLQILLFLSFLPVAVNSQTIKKADSDLKNWIGKYAYTYAESINVGGSVPTIEYQIVVSAKGDALDAEFTADGYQSNTNYYCTVKAAGNQLDLYFLKDLNDPDMERRIGRLKRGQLVGSLVKTTVRGRTKYIFKDKVFFNPKYPPTFKKS